MILQQTTMQMSKMIKGVDGHASKLVLLWVEVGLCIHKSAYAANGNGYTISHFNSGKIILSNIPTRQKAEVYMQKLAEILEDWRFTLKEWENYPPIDKTMIKEEVDKLKHEILKGE